MALSQQQIASMAQSQQQLRQLLQQQSINWQQVFAIIGSLIALLFGGAPPQQLQAAAGQDCCEHCKCAMELEARSLAHLVDCCCEMEKKNFH